MGGWGKACRESLRYSRYLWTHVALTTIAGGVFGLLPYSLCLQTYADSLASIPRNVTVSLYPDEWTERDWEVLNKPAFLGFWLLRNTWCTVGDYLPMLLALHSSPLKTKVPLAASLCSMVAVIVAETLLMWRIGQASEEGRPHGEDRAHEEGDGHYREVEDTIKVFKYAVMFVVNTLAVSCAESSEFRWRKLLPIAVLTFLPFLLLLIQDTCIIIYLFNREWYVRMLVTCALTSVVRPVLLEVTLVASECLISLRQDASQTRLGVYIAISCSSLVLAMQVSGGAPWETALVYSYMMVAEVWRNRNYLTGKTELAQAATACRWAGAACQHCLGCMRGLLGMRPRDEAEATMEDIKSVDGERNAAWEGAASVTSLPTLRSARPAVMGDLVAISNIMEGAMIMWISVLFLTVKLSPYEEAGEPLAWQVVLANCLMGLFMEALTDFASYAVVCCAMPPGGVYRDFDVRVGIGADRVDFLWTFTVVLAISTKTVASLYVELCPTQAPGTTLLMSLSICPH